jgi:hypothetical protein
VLGPFATMTPRLFDQDRRRIPNNDTRCYSHHHHHPHFVVVTLPNIWLALVQDSSDSSSRSSRRVGTADHHQVSIVGVCPSSGEETNSQTNVSFDCSSCCSFFFLFVLLLQHHTHSPGRILTITLQLCYHIVVVGSTRSWMIRRPRRNVKR